MTLNKTDRIVSPSKRLAADRLWFCIHGVLSTSYLGHRKGLDRWLKQRKIANVYQGRNIVAVSQAVGDDLRGPVEERGGVGHDGFTPPNRRSREAYSRQAAHRSRRSKSGKSFSW